MSDTAPASFDPLERFQVLYADADFTLGVSHHRVDGHDRVHLHLTVHRFAPSVLRRMEQVFQDERPKLPAIIGAIFNHTDPVGAHFARRYGWIPVGAIPWWDGALHTLWVHISPDGRVNTTHNKKFAKDPWAA